MDSSRALHARIAVASAAIHGGTDDDDDDVSSMDDVPPPPSVDVGALLADTVASAAVAAAAVAARDKARRNKRRMLEVAPAVVADAIPQLLLLHPMTLRKYMPTGGVRLEWTRPTHAHKTVRVPASEWSVFVGGLQQVCKHPALRVPDMPASLAASAVPASPLGTVRRIRSRASVLAILGALYGVSPDTPDLSADDVWAARFTLAGRSRVTLVIDGVQAARGVGLLFLDDLTDVIASTPAPAPLSLALVASDAAATPPMCSTAPFYIRGASRVGMGALPWLPTSGAFNADSKTSETSTVIDFDVGGWSLPAFAILQSLLHFFRTTVQATYSYRLRIVDSTSCPGDASDGVVFKSTVQQLVAFMQRVYIHASPLTDAKLACQRLCASLPASRAHQLVQLLQHIAPRVAVRPDDSQRHLAEEDDWGDDAIDGALVRAISKSRVSAEVLRALARLMDVPMPPTLTNTPCDARDEQ